MAHENRAHPYHHRSGGDFRRADRMRTKRHRCNRRDRAVDCDRRRARDRSFATRAVVARGVGRSDRQGERSEDRRASRRELLSDRGIYAEVIRRMSQHLWRFIFAIAGVAMGAAMEVLKPWPLKVLIDNVLSGKPLQFAPFAQYSKMNLLIAA